MPDVDEYLEKLFSDGFKREIDSDESVWRTLPFFATAIGITGTLLGYDGSRLPDFSWQPIAIILYALFIGGIVCLAVSFAWLFNAVRQRTYRYPPSEIDLNKLATEFRDYHHELGLEDEALEAQVLKAMRSVMVDEYAQSASFNRELNRAKLLSRSQAIFYLMVGLAICFAYGSLAFVEQKLAPRPASDGGAAHGQRGQAQQPAPAVAHPGGGAGLGANTAPQASAADDPGRRTSVRLPAVARSAIDGRGVQTRANAAAPKR